MPTTTLADTIQQEAQENAFLCYQCKKCTSGCPLADQMDLTPNQIMRAIQLDRTDLVLGSKTIWLCASCETCTTRCPSEIDIAKVMSTLKILAQRQGVRAKVPSVPLFVDSSLRSIQTLGRLYEVGTIAQMNLLGGNLTKDVGLGIKMLSSGKLRLLPEVARTPRAPDRGASPAPAKTAVAYYPGCSLHGTASEYDHSMRAVAAALGLALEEPKGWTCCGSSAAHWKSHYLGALLPARNLSLIEWSGYQAVTAPCAACFSRLRSSALELETNPHLRQEIAADIGYEYRGTVAVEHAISTFVNRVGLEAIAGKVTRPLKGLKVACYYGCLLTRPPEVTGADDPEYPMNMDRIVRALGAETVDWSYKTECCGASLSLTETGACLPLVDRILRNAQEEGAEAVVVGCSMCQANLDTRQPDLARAGKQHGLPVVYFTQLMGLALGLPEKPLGLGKHIVDPRPLLGTKGIV